MEPIKVIIVDDSDFVRDGMKIILDVDEEFEVMGCASNGVEAIDLAKKFHPDIIIMDIQMPVMDGIKATEEIVRRNLGKVLILTTFDDDTLVKQALKNGAAGYLIKNHTPEQLKQTIKSIGYGIHSLDEKIFQKATESSLHVRSGFDPDLFTSRELDIIRLIADGLSNKEIAQNLFLSEGTVKNYISTILEKGGLQHRTQVAVYYLTGRK